MRFEFSVEGSDYSLDVEKGEQGLNVDFDGHNQPVDATFLDPNTISLVIEGRTVTVYIAFDGDRIHASVGGDKFQIEKDQASALEDQPGVRGGALVAETTISTPMPGQIVKIQVKKGEIVQPGQNLFIVESMKMENQIKSSIKAKVEEVHFGDGDPVDANAPIVELTPITDETDA
jgi:biotin carboxyl carrier protein